MYIELNPTMTKILDDSILLSSDEQKRLVKEYKESGNLSHKEKIMKSTYRFVFNIARYYHLKTGIDINDLFSEGVIGLSKGIDRFNPNSKYKFLSYVVWYIKKEVLSYLNNNYNGDVRMPAERVIESIKNYNKGLTGEKSTYVGKVINNDGEVIDIFDTIEQDMYSPIEDKLNNKEIRLKIMNIMSNFDELERKIFIYHSLGRMSLDECHDYFKISHERMKEIRYRIINIIKSHFSPELIAQLNY